MNTSNECLFRIRSEIMLGLLEESSICNAYRICACLTRSCMCSYMFCIQYIFSVFCVYFVCWLLQILFGRLRLVVSNGFSNFLILKPCREIQMRADTFIEPKGRKIEYGLGWISMWVALNAEAQLYHKLYPNWSIGSMGSPFLGLFVHEQPIWCMCKGHTRFQNLKDHAIPNCCLAHYYINRQEKVKFVFVRRYTMNEALRSQC